MISISEGRGIIAWDLPATPNSINSWGDEGQFIPDFTSEQRDAYRTVPVFGQIG
jgi:hypothetical protein